jgi:hypothetical protein
VYGVVSQKTNLFVGTVKRISNAAKFENLDGRLKLVSV